MRSDFQVLINGRDAFYADVPDAPIAVEAPFEYELEQARRHAGISIREWDNMAGTHFWLKDGEMQCKSDYVMLYRIYNQTEGASHEAMHKEARKRMK